MTENKTLSNLSSVFDSATRIQIMASLTVSPLTYAQLKKICQVTDGKLFRHIDKLIEEGSAIYEIINGIYDLKKKLIKIALIKIIINKNELNLWIIS